MKRPEPKKFSNEEVQKFEEAASKQSQANRTPLTVDEKKYPMFEIPVCEKRLIYVPNLTHTELDEETGEEVTVLNWDKGAFHTVRSRGSFMKFRCNSGITGIEGFDGTCPLCETMSDNWDLYSHNNQELGKMKGVDINTEEGKEATKEDRRKLLQEMAVSGKQIELTFPIWNIELEKGKLTPAKDADGSIKATLEWYTIKQDTWNGKWVPTFQTLPEGEQHAAGKFWLLDYTYDFKNGKPTKMQSANALKVLVKSMGKDYDEVAKILDEGAATWTPALAREVIFANMVYDNEALQPIADEVMEPVRHKLLIEREAKSSAGAIAGNQPKGIPESIANSFQATQADVGVEAE